MRIGILPGLNPSNGGVYQYSLTMLDALAQSSTNGCADDFVVFASDVGHPALARLNRALWTVKPAEPPSLPRRSLNVMRRLIGEGPHRQAWRAFREWQAPVPRLDPDLVTLRPDVNRWFRRFSVELMLYPVPNPLSFEAGIPYVMAIHDLQHRLQPEFPEVSANGEWDLREYHFRNGSRYATLLLADSEAGKEDILTFYGPYGVTADRIKVLPFIPASYLSLNVPESERERVRANYHLPEEYIFYPAQFWPHKNHAALVRALGLLKQEYHLEIPLVLCGSHSGEVRERAFQEVMSLADGLGVGENIHYLGYVPDEDISGIYAQARALAKPTFFGPGSIPVLEAWAFGCPVLTSDIRGLRERVQDAGILVDPRSVEAIADGIRRLWTDAQLRTTLVTRGRQRLSGYTPEDFRRRLADILEEAKVRVRSEPPRRAGGYRRV